MNYYLQIKNLLLESKARRIKKMRKDPYNWKMNYGKTFKFANTPVGKQIPPTDEPTVSLVTPANNDAWNWPELKGKQKRGFRKNWKSIKKDIPKYKRIQIETGKNTTMDDV